jgi:hypothetical protein
VRTAARSCCSSPGGSPGVTELLAQQVAIVEGTLVLRVRAATGDLIDVKGLELRADPMLGILQDIDEVLKGKHMR